MTQETEHGHIHTPDCLEHPHHEHRPTGRLLLELKDVCVGWDGRNVLSNINLSVHQGDFIAITGPNGGGKTTLLRVMLGLIKPMSGQVVRHMQGMRVGYLPQKNMIDSHFPITVREVIQSGLLVCKRLTSAEKTEAYDRAIERVGLQEHADRPIGLLSGGQLQRALLARAIISHPGVLVLDEPLSYIDQRFEQQLYKLIEEISKDTTIALVSHQMSTIAGMANRHFIVDHTLHECPAHRHFIYSDCR